MTSMTWTEVLERESGEVPCRYDAEMWFSEGYQPHAAAFCETCPVQLRCLVLGLSEDYGVWGGLSARRRRDIRREMFPGDTTDRVGERTRPVALAGAEDDVDLLTMLPPSRTLLSVVSEW